MSEIHQICPVCAACNTKQKDGYYMCCACRHKWRDVESASVFDHITQNVGMLANELVYYLPEIDKYTSEIIAVFYKDRDEAFAATIEELKKEWKYGKDIDVPANGADNNVGSMEVNNG